MLENLLVQMSIKSFVASLQGHEKLLYLKKDFTKIFVACASDETWDMLELLNKYSLFAFFIGSQEVN